MHDNKELTVDIYDEGQQDELIAIDDNNDGQKIKTIEDAVRYAYGLSRTREEIKQYEEIAQKEIAKWQSKIEQVQKWLEDVTTPLKSKEQYLINELRIFHITQYNSASNDKERKKLTSIKLPYGITLQSRAQQNKFEVVDEQKYKEYAKENNYLKPPEEPTVDWATLKKDLVVDNEGKVLNKETGELLDFIKAVPQERKFEVK